MTSRTRHHNDPSVADPWWGEPEPTLAAPVAEVATPRRRGRPRRVRRGIGWTLLGLALAPLQLLARAIVGSPRMRRYGMRLVLLSVVLLFLACSVGVILINNVVIGRTAELGKLDTQRRELRRDNALLGAEEARLAQPSIVVKHAAKQLGMVQSRDLPKFIFVEPGSHQLTPYQLRARRRVLTPAAAPTTTTPTKEP